MITRVVKLTLRPEKVNAFVQNFKENQDKIRASYGCLELRLYRDTAQVNVFFTYSHWLSAQELEDYRKSDLFKGVWSVVKPMFMSPAEAWSLDGVSFD
jgi:autoinducer 2-degrading protein